MHFIICASSMQPSKRSWKKRRKGANKKKPYMIGSKIMKLQ